MEKESGGIIEQIAELRTKAGEQLQGNEYFVMANQLDTLLVSDDVNDPDKDAVLEDIRARLASDVSAAEPETVADNDGESDGIMDHIAQLRAKAVEQLQGNEYFIVAQQLDAILAGVGPGSADAAAALQAIHARLDIAAPAPSTDMDEGLLILEPRGNSFGMPQPTVAHSLIKDDTGTDNVQDLASGEEPEAQETPAPATGFAAVEPETVAVEERTGFDTLTNASWRRVQQVSQSDSVIAPLVNGHATGDADLAEAEAEAKSVAAVAAANITEEPIVAEIEEAPAEHVNVEIETQAPLEEPVSDYVAESVKTEVFEEECEIIMENASEDAPAGGFKFTPQLLIMNRPVKKDGSLRPKRAAKLPHVPKKRS